MKRDGNDSRSFQRYARKDETSRSKFHKSQKVFASVALSPAEVCTVMTILLRTYSNGLPIFMTANGTSNVRFMVQNYMPSSRANKRRTLEAATAIVAQRFVPSTPNTRANNCCMFLRIDATLQRWSINNRASILRAPLAAYY
jgi:hypothetical protein